jgi:hypothetical protein
VDRITVGNATRLDAPRDARRRRARQTFFMGEEQEELGE